MIYMFTGVAGQLGRAFVRTLTKNKDNYIIGLCRESELERAKTVFAQNQNIVLASADSADSASISGAIRYFRPDVVGHLGAKSSVHGANESPIEYFYSNTVSTINILNAIKSAQIKPKFFNMSSIEIFGNSEGVLLESRNENTPICPSNQYGSSKAAAHIYVDTYRKTYGLHVYNVISGNFISEFQNSNFVIGKVLNYLETDAFLGKKLKLGNINSIRDWTYVDDIVDGILCTLDCSQPENYCIASGNIATVENVISILFKYYDLNYLDFIEIENKLFRIGDTNFVNIDCSKLRATGWFPKYSLIQSINQIMLNKKVI